MNWEEIDWDALERMRAAFLSGTAGGADYWQSESDLAAYDATFAQRIGWKWDFVLGELKQRGWQPPQGELIDWGCGSGVAGRAFLDFFGADRITKLRLWDRSSLAMNFAAKQAKAKYPEIEVNTATEPRSAQGAILVISHVSTELAQPETERLVELAASATAVIWVEPGTYESSLTLIAIRERLRGGFQIIAPCTHGHRCGILAPQNERHWCHHFASPPAEVFTDGGWAQFANLLGIDLRDLPLSFLVLDRRKSEALPADAVRLLGHPRLYKGYALLLGCDDCGVAEKRLAQRRFPELFKAFKKGRHGSLGSWKFSENEITELNGLD